ncbi:MAG: winged helix DNA-binding domain-containing protein [Taibaiella sp.]|jgi:hypothetical protein
MKEKELLSYRLFNQQLSASTLQTPAELVSWIGAVQAQDYAMAKWAIGLRLKNANDDIIEKAITDGSIIRTHVLRTTWHLVTPEDIRWMLQLTAPGIYKQMAYYDRQLDIEQRELMKSAKLFEKTLTGKKQLTRPELEEIFTKAKFNCDGMRFGHLLMHAELQGLICSGAKKGKQITYALLEERVPATRKYNRDESLAMLTRKYFQSHGPATLKDYMWWSGLTAKEAKEGIALLEGKINNVSYNEEVLWYIDLQDKIKMDKTIYLLPNYDEYIVGYTNRDALMPENNKNKLSREGNPLFINTIIINGQVCGTWKRTLKANEVMINSTVFGELSMTNKKQMEQAEQRFKQFLIKR